MAAGPDANVHEDHGHDAPLQDHPDHAAHDHGGHSALDDPDGHVDAGHDAHGHVDAGHDAHGHDDHGHGSAGDAWVLPPLLVGLVIGLVIAVLLGFGSGAVTFN